MKKKLLLSLVAFVSILGLVACGGNSGAGKKAGQESAESKPSVFTLGIDDNPTSTNPISTSDRWGLTYVNMIFSPLIRLEANGERRNDLAESYKVAEDGLSATVTLKKDVTFSDGKPVTADDVVFTYEKKADKANGNASKFWINDKPVTFEKVDDRTVKFILPEKNAAFVDNILAETYILPKHVYENVDFSGKTVDVDPVGSGPYKLKENKPDEYIHFEANDSYYQGKPNIQNIYFRIIKKGETLKQSLKSGDIDAAFVLPNDVDEFKDAPLELYTYSENRIEYLGLDTSKEALKNVKVRQAIFYALDKESLNKAAYKNSDYFSEPNSIFPVANPYLNKDVETYKTNVEKAKELLKEAGVSNLKLTLGYSSTSDAAKLQAPLIQEQLKKAGIDVELSGVDSTAFATEIRKEDSKYDLFIHGYIMGNDPDQYARFYQTGSRFNYFKINDATIQDLFAKGIVELDTEKRRTIYDEAQAKVADAAVIYPITDPKKVLAVNTRIAGVKEAGLVPIFIFEYPSKLEIK